MGLNPKKIIQLDAFNKSNIENSWFAVHREGQQYAQKVSFQEIADLVSFHMPPRTLIWVIGVDKPSGNTITDSRLKGRKVNALLINNVPVTEGYTHNHEDPDDEVLDFTAMDGVNDGEVIHAYLA